MDGKKQRIGIPMSLTWILLLVSLACSCPFDEPNSPKWNPMVREFYLKSTFSQNLGEKYQLGVDFSTGEKEGLPVQAPENGVIVELDESPLGLGKALVFLGESGNKWLYGNLGNFSLPLDSIFEAEKKRQGKNQLRLKLAELQSPKYKEYDTVAYSGSSGIGTRQLHMELWDIKGLTAINPCMVGVACHDSIAPKIMEAAIWDAANPVLPMRFTSAEALEGGCLEVDPMFQEPRIALRIFDESQKSFPSSLGVFSVLLRQNTEVLYRKEYQEQALKVGKWKNEEILDHDWHYLATGSVHNPNVKGFPTDLSAAIRNQMRMPAKKASLNVFKIELMDARLNPATYHLIAKPSCTPSSKRLGQVDPDSLLFTLLSRPWVNFAGCEKGVKVALLDSSKQILEKSVCDSVDHLPMQVAGILRKWPLARTITFGGKIPTPRAVAIFPLSSGAPIAWKQDDISIALTPLRPVFPTALAWEVRNERWSFHPKGLAVNSSIRTCLPDTCWNSVHIGNFERINDSTAPDIGNRRDTSGLRFGKPTRVLRFHIQEDGSGINNANDIQAKQGQVWIPVEYDPDTHDIQIQTVNLKAGVPIEIHLQDGKGNNRIRLVEVKK
jgi:hypothetical protein